MRLQVEPLLAGTEIRLFRARSTNIRRVASKEVPCATSAASCGECPEVRYGEHDSTVCDELSSVAEFGIIDQATGRSLSTE